MSNRFLMGNEAFAHAALEAGVRVCAGYPGTPSSEVIETIARGYKEGWAKGVHVEWSTNEKAALEVLIGASHAGARTLFTCKQMGLNVASDALMSYNYVGTNGGTVLFVADDPGPISSQTEQDTRRFAAFAKVPVFDPATPEQGFEMIKEAYEVSERYHTPVIVRATTRICHASTFFEVADETQAREPDGFTKDDSRWVIFPPRAYAGHGEINERLPKIAHDCATEEALVRFNPCKQAGDAPELGIVAGGISHSYALEALRMIEKKAAEQGVQVPAYRIIQIGTPYPFPAEAVDPFAEGLSRVIVFEELDYVLEEEMLKYAGRNHCGFEVCGKLTGDTLERGENSIDAIYDQLVKFFGLELAADKPAEAQIDAFVPERPPSLCPGCPHRGAFYAIKQAVHRKHEVVMCGDIGCYTLGNAKPLEAVDTCLCMGAGVTMAQGFSIVEPGKKAIAYIGDSTYFASGMTGVANAVYNGHDITIVVLDNATTAMTGAQPHPGTGKRLMGGHSKPISIRATLEAMGVQKITRANPLFAEDAIAAASEAIEFDGPSAVVYEWPCTKLLKPKPPAYFIANACAGCRMCVTRIGCPALTWDDQAKVIVVDRDLCVGCGLCTDVCQYHALACVTRKRKIKQLPPRSTRLHSDDGSLSRFPTPEELSQMQADDASKGGDA